MNRFLRSRVPNSSVLESAIPPLIQEGSTQQDQYLVETNIDSSISHTQKRARGPTRMMHVWNAHWERPQVVCNKYGQPEDKIATKLSNYIGTITRNGKIAPLDADDWHKMPKENKEFMWKLIQMKFDVPADAKNWAMKLCGKKIKDWKATLKRKYYKEYLSYEEQMQCKDARVIKEQWESLIMHWDTEKAKELSEKNKVARALRKYNHTTGTKSFARVRAVEKAKMNNKSPPRAHLFKTCYKRKDGVTDGGDLDDVINQLSAKENENPNETHDATIHNDVFAQVMGNDKNGRVRMFGLGVSPSDLSSYVRGHKSNQNKRLSAMQEENSDLRLRNKVLESRLRELNAADADLQDGDESNDIGETLFDNNYVRKSGGRMQKRIEFTPYEKSLLVDSNLINTSHIMLEAFNCVGPNKSSLPVGSNPTNGRSTSMQYNTNSQSPEVHQQTLEIRRKADNPELQKGLNVISSSLNHTDDTIGNTLENREESTPRREVHGDFNLLEQARGVNFGSAARKEITPSRDTFLSSEWTSFSSMLNGPYTQVGDEVVLKSILNTSETIAYGIVESTDPLKEVEGEQLGSGYWEVYIQTAIKDDERLIRPYGQIRTIGDAVGGYVVWPAPFVASPNKDARLQMVDRDYTDYY